MDFSYQTIYTKRGFHCQAFIQRRVVAREGKTAYLNLLSKFSSWTKNQYLKCQKKVQHHLRMKEV